MASQAAAAHYQRLEYPAALAAVAAVEQCPDGTAAELVEALTWRAQAKAANADPAGAVEAFALVVTLQPDYAFDPMASPKFLELFKQGKARAQTGQVFGRLVRREGADVELQVFDPLKKVRRVAAAFDVPAGVEVEARPVDALRWRSTVPEGAQLASVVLESGERTLFKSVMLPLAGLPGPASAPAAAVVAQKPPAVEDGEPNRRWLLVGVGVGALVVVGLVVGLSVGLAPHPIDGSLGRVELPLEGGR